MRPTAPRRRSDTTPLAQRAFVQHGVVSWSQLRELGFSEHRITGLVGSGHLIRVLPGVYAVGHARLTAKGQWMAAVLACGPGARLSHRDALALFGLRRIGAGPVHVTAAGTHRLAGVRCHTTRSWQALGTTFVDGVPATELERAVLDVASTEPVGRVRSLLEEIERHGRFDLRRFKTLLAQSGGHRGIGRVRAALAELDDVAPLLNSDLEGEFLARVRDAGLPEPSANVIVAGELFDFHWPAQRVIAEIDSWRYHRSRRSFEDDRRRANVAALAGQTLLRITDRRIAHEPAAVLAEVTAALVAGGWRI